MRCGKRCTSFGQPTATAILPAQYRASASSRTSTTAKPPRCLTAPNPLRGPANDTAYLEAFLAERTDGPIVLVGHS
jgi:hypothetical protein